MDEDVIALLIPIVGIVGGLGIAAYSMYLKVKARQMMHQERLAMIERGLTPPPLDALSEDWPKRRRVNRHVGVVLIAVGIGLFVLISLQSDLRAAVGVGGLLVVLGSGFLVNAMLDRRAESSKGSDGRSDQEGNRAG